MALCLGRGAAGPPFGDPRAALIAVGASLVELSRISLPDFRSELLPLFAHMVAVEIQRLEAALQEMAFDPPFWAAGQCAG